MLQFIDKHAALGRKFTHRDDLIHRTPGDDRQPTDFKGRDKKMVRLIRRDLGWRKYRDLPSRLFDGIVQHEILARQLADKTNENRKIDLIEIQSDSPAAIWLGKRRRMEQHSPDYGDQTGPKNPVSATRKNPWKAPRETRWLPNHGGDRTTSLRSDTTKLGAAGDGVQRLPILGNVVQF